MVHHQKRTCQDLSVDYWNSKYIPLVILGKIAQGNDCRGNRPNRLLSRRLCDESPLGRALHISMGKIKTASPYTSASTNIRSLRLQPYHYTISWMCHMEFALGENNHEWCVVISLTISVDRDQSPTHGHLLMGRESNGFRGFRSVSSYWRRMLWSLWRLWQCVI